MLKISLRQSVTTGIVFGLLSTGASAVNFDIGGGDLRSALNAYAAQTGVTLMVSDEAIKGVRSEGVQGDLTNDAALAHLLAGTGFIAEHHSGGVAVVRTHSERSDAAPLLEVAQAAPVGRAVVETVTVTSSKLGGADVQIHSHFDHRALPGAIDRDANCGRPRSGEASAEPDVHRRRTSPDTALIFAASARRRFRSRPIQPSRSRLNDIPFIRNHFFEQEFYDLSQAEVLRGPQGTLYGRNATAGVVNVISAKPTDQFEAMASGESAIITTTLRRYDQPAYR